MTRPVRLALEEGENRFAHARGLFELQEVSAAGDLLEARFGIGQELEHVVHQRDIEAAVVIDVLLCLGRRQRVPPYSTAPN